MEQCKELWYNSLNLIGYEYLIAIELNLITLQFDIVLYTWEIKNTRKVEWVVNVQVNPKQWLVIHWEESTIEALVVFILQT